MLFWPDLFYDVNFVCSQKYKIRLFFQWRPWFCSLPFIYCFWLVRNGPYPSNWNVVWYNRGPLAAVCRYTQQLGDDTCMAEGVAMEGKKGSASNKGIPLWSKSNIETVCFQHCVNGSLMYNDFAIPRVKTSMNLIVLPGVSNKGRRLAWKYSRGDSWLHRCFILRTRSLQVEISWIPYDNCMQFISPINIHSWFNRKGKPQNSFDSVWPICTFTNLKAFPYLYIEIFCSCWTFALN